MRLTATMLTKLEQSMRIMLTPEQRVIMLYWYKNEPRYGWDEDEFVYGIDFVRKHYPDHRPKRNPLPEFLRETPPESEPF